MKPVILLLAVLISFAFHSYLAVHVASIDCVLLNEYTAFIFSLWPFLIYLIVGRLVRK